MVNNNNFLNYSLKLCAIFATLSLITIGCSSEEPKTATSTTPRPNTPTTTTQKPAGDPGAVVSGAPTTSPSSSRPAKTSTAKKPRTQNTKKTGTISSIVDDPSLYGAADPPAISRGTGKE